MSAPVLIGLGLGVAILWVLEKSFPRGLPPGPRGLPIVGNIADMPKEKEWITFSEWGRKWGGILSVKILGRPIIIVNSVEIMGELEKKGSIYSDRPVLQMGGELMGYSETVLLIPYGPRHRTYRKHFSRYLGSPKPIQQLFPIVDAQTREFLKRILEPPDDLLAHLRQLAGGIILRLTYGYEVQTGEDSFVNLIEHANKSFSAATVPGAYLVESLPSLKMLPEWLPGMGFLEVAREGAKDAVAMINVPYEFTRTQMAAGTAVPSFVSTAFEDEGEMSPEAIRDLKFTACSMYGGGADTTVSAEYAFFLAMVLFPEVQKKAQAELDAVIGTERLPTLDDQPSLPYINAIVSEVLRWNSVTPTGVPHTATEDGYVNGYFIPKGSMILTNLWNMLHDPAIYPDPFNFEPERHIAGPGKEPQYDPRKICFGYARRICPGRYLAEASLFSCIATSLAAFNIDKVEENGVPITPVHDNTSGIISYPKAFKCAIRPRSAKVVSIIGEKIL